jgi:hypothetical protein
VSAGVPGDAAPEKDPDAAPAAAPPTPADRRILALFAAWTALLVLGAFAQWTQNRFLLDLFDLRRWFTR